MQPHNKINDNHETRIKIEGLRRSAEWTDETEALALEWKEKAEKASIVHNGAGLSNKYKHIITGLPVIIIPSIFAPLTAALGSGSPGIEYVSMVGFITTGIMGGINGLFGFNQNHQRHMDFSARYSDIASDIQYELLKQRNHRNIPPDQFLMRVQMKMDNLNAQAPNL